MCFISRRGRRREERGGREIIDDSEIAGIDVSAHRGWAISAHRNYAAENKRDDDASLSRKRSAQYNQRFNVENNKLALRRRHRLTGKAEAVSLLTAAKSLHREIAPHLYSLGKRRQAIEAILV